MPNNPGTPEARQALDGAAWERFTATRGGASKFWRVRHAGRHLETWWGRIGTEGQRHVKTWPDFGGIMEAATAHRELCHAKLAKGYDRDNRVADLPVDQLERTSWAVQYQGNFRVGTAQAIAFAAAAACSNSAQERIVAARVRALIELGGGCENVMSAAGSGLGTLVVSREPGDGLLDAQRLAERSREERGREMEILAARSPGTIWPQRPDARVHMVAVPLRNARPQVDPVSGRVAVYALRDVRNSPGGPIVHPRGFKQMLRTADAAEVVTGSLDYGYEQPEPIDAMPEVERRLREQSAQSAEAIRASIPAIRDFAEEVAAISEGRARQEYDSIAATTHGGISAITTEREALRMRNPRRPGGDHHDFRLLGSHRCRDLERIPWLIFVDQEEILPYWRIRICGRWLGLWTGGERGAQETREYYAQGGEALPSPERAASIAFHALVTEALVSGYIPETAALRRRVAVDIGFDRTAPRARANVPVSTKPQGTVALARFAGIDLGDEEEI